MKKHFLLAVFLAALHCMPFILRAADDYSDHRQMTARLQTLASDHPALVSLRSLATTVGGKDIWMLEIGSGDLDTRPAIAIVGGVSGDHLIGSEMAVQFAEALISRSGDPQIGSMLGEVTFYVFPDMSPDARAQYFAPLKYERLGNANPTDLDRDGRIGEDPYNDLNGDGLITLMRVADPTGQWMKHPEDERVMVPARPEKGEKGAYRVYSEGIDEDKDGQWNEDGEEGVIFNRNFAFNYPAFQRGAGENAVSEIETRAIADFLYDAKNVFAVVTFGPANNLSHPLTYNERNASSRISTGWQERDVKINELVSKVYGDLVSPPRAPRSPGVDGDFFQWAYFHYGRYSFSTPAWWVPVPEGGAQESNAEVLFLNWAEQKGLKDVFVPWTSVSHPDFPGKEVEVGGIAPFAKTNPPYSMIEPLAESHYSFIMELASMRPSIDILNLKTESLGGNLYRITADIANVGSFPTASALGQRLRWVQKTVVRLETGTRQQVVSGRTIEVLSAIEGHDSVQRSWLVQGRGTVNLRAGAESTGFKEIQITL